MQAFKRLANSWGEEPTYFSKADIWKYGVLGNTRLEAKTFDLKQNDYYLKPRP